MNHATSDNSFEKRANPNGYQSIDNCQSKEIFENDRNVFQTFTAPSNWTNNISQNLVLQANMIQPTEYN